MYEEGKKIVYIIATLFLIMSFITLLMDLEPLVFIARLIVALALYKGISWFRYIYAVAAAVGSLVMAYIFIITDYGLVMQESKIFIVFYFIYEIAFLLFYLGSSIIIFKNKKVGLFFKGEKNS